MYEVNQPEYYSVWRKRHHVTQLQVAKYVGCSGALISYWERGEKELPGEMIKKYDEYIINFDDSKYKK